MKTFKDLKLNKELMKAIEKLGFEKPTQIQEKSIPAIIEGKDVIGHSATGSGKTLAFGTGVIEKTIPGQGIQSLILTPTRELAQQVTEELERLSNHTLKIVPIYGGVEIDKQFRKLESADVVVATPGRLLDHMYRKTISLKQIKVLVLDEADRMLDMGFIDDVEMIIKECPRNKQTLFFSATIDERLQRITKKYMKNALNVCAVKQVDPSKLRQVYYDIDRKQKIKLLINLLKRDEGMGLVMVFCNTRISADYVAKYLRANKIKSIAIHGGFKQNRRTKTMKMFSEADIDVLACTDVAARGLHIDDVSHVYNYEIPNDPRDYVHRIGRTARAGKDGKVINLISNMDYDNFSRVVTNYREMTINNERVPRLEKIKFPGIVKDDDDRIHRVRPGSRRHCSPRSKNSNSYGRQDNRGRSGRDRSSNSASSYGGNRGRSRNRPSNRHRRS